ncbi:hypothetical protein M6B38_387065 [Iris pallida]|uniref:Uncharacterized protein n=1 Tax=Iris pallida TaxID=29817 RepID=A0AAX6G2T9_IRIPA|nr:hypothetical protein M6B38_387065 [Iris pallida]
MKLERAAAIKLERAAAINLGRPWRGWPWREQQLPRRATVDRSLLSTTVQPSVP